MAMPKWSPEEKEWIKRAAREAGPGTCTYSKQELKRRAERMRGVRKRFLEKQREVKLCQDQKAVKTKTKSMKARG